MNIADDGKGFDASGVFNGEPDEHINKRAAELNGFINITLHLNKGASAQLHLKSHKQVIDM